MRAPSAPGGTGGPAPPSRSYCLFCFLFPYLGLAKKIPTGHHCKSWIFLSCPPLFSSPSSLKKTTTKNKQLRKLEWGVGLKAKNPFPSHCIFSDMLLEHQACYLLSQELSAPFPSLRGGSPPPPQKNLCTHCPLPTPRDPVPARKPSPSLSPFPSVLVNF